MIIDRYVRSEMTRLFFGLTSILLFVFTSQQIVRYLNMVTSGKVASGIFFKLIAIEIPYLLSMLMPVGFYLAVLLSLNRLYVDQEMVILKQMGLTPMRLLRVTFQSVLPIIILLVLLMFFINPNLSSVRQSILHQSSATTHLIDTLAAGRFQITPDGKNVIYAMGVHNQKNVKKASQIFLFKELNHFDQSNVEKELVRAGDEWRHRKNLILLAKEAYEDASSQEDNRYFIAEKGVRYQGAPADKGYEVTKFSKYKIRLSNESERLLHPAEEVFSMTQLWRDQADPHIAAELQWRISIPLSVLLLALFALPISHVMPRQHRLWSLLLGIISFLAYFNLLIVAKHWVEVQRVSSTIGLWWVHGLFILIILSFYLFKSRKNL